MAQPRVTPRHRWLLAFLILLLLFLAVIDEYAGWRFLLFGLGGAWALSRYWARSLSRSLRLRREMRFGWAQVGDRLEERLTLTNESSLPAVYAQIVDHSDLPGYSINQVRAAEGTSSTTWRATGQCSRRGLFTLGPTTLLTSDPLGLYTVELHDPRSVQLMVTPPVVPLPHIQVAPGGMAGEGRPRPNAPERTVSASSVREYLPGDSLRMVHWRTTARQGQLHVRTFDNTPLGDWWLILDANQGVQAGEGARSTAEHSIILAASLTDRGLSLGRGVGLAAEGDSLIWLPPGQGDGQRWAILRALALLEPGRRSLADLLVGLSPSLGKDSSLVLITPDVSGEWLEALLPLIWRGLAPTVLVLDPASFDPSPAVGRSGTAHRLAGELARQGISHQVITSDLLDRPEARPGKVGAWGWRVTPSGRAIADEPSLTAPWRSL
jgi:uncharacterized protein (DUF58 family)